MALSETDPKPYHKREKIAGGGIIISIAFLLLSGALNYFGSNPRILYLPAAGLCLFILYATHIYVRSELAKRHHGEETSQVSNPAVVPQSPVARPLVPDSSPTLKPKTQRLPRPKPSEPEAVNPPLRSLSDGQRYMLSHRLEAYGGHTAGIALIGNDPQNNILFEQLIDIFRQCGWITETAQIGMVGAVGANFPANPYLTSGDISAPIVSEVFSIFSRAGVNLPLTPNAVSPFTAKKLDIVIVIH